MLDKVKLELRISSDSFDTELNELIEASKMDMELSGVDEKAINEDDPLISRAIKLYCKSNFGMDNKESGKYHKAYNLLKQHLALSCEYGG